MNKTIKNPNEIDLGIGIHLTPMLGLVHVIRAFHCNHSTHLTCQFNILRRVTQLHLGEENEN